MKRCTPRFFIGSGLFLIVLTACYSTISAKTTEPATKSAITADVALAQLSKGNERFVAGKSQHPNATMDRLALTAKEGQHPLATILSCSDSRVPVELIFDQGFGDVFVVRVAGNVSGGDQTGTIEYGVEHLETPLLIIMGHSQCGAVTAAATNAKAHGHLHSLIEKIKPAVECAKRHNPNLKEKELVTKAISCNVWLTIEDLLKNDQTIRELVKEGKLKVVGALYDISTGKIDWLGTHPAQDKLLNFDHAHAK